jgi:hypothetical protein
MGEIAALEERAEHRFHGRFPFDLAQTRGGGRS